MRSKKFTLIEIVSVIFILTLLLSIVLIKYDDFKKKSVYSAVSSNVKILQTAVDTYYLKNEKYPTKKATSISNPQLINIDILVEEGLIKKGLDLRKIKSQNYWVDTFGRVWGATEMHPTSINVLESNDKKTFEFTLEGDVSKYNIYEVKGYNQSKYVSYKEVDIEKPNERVALADGVDKYYRLVKTVDVEGKVKPLSDSFTTLNKDSIYLISIEDEFGLETVPYGLTDNNDFEPLISFEGTREFEIEGTKVMKWIDFYTIEKKPEGSSITYRFKVKDSNGNYGDWSNDFYSLPSSKGIVVEITMKANSQKEKPSLYDLRVIYEFEDGGQKTKYIPNPPLILPADELDSINPNGGSISKGGGSVEVPPSGVTDNERPTTNPPKGDNSNGGESGDSGNDKEQPEEDKPTDGGTGGSGSNGNGVNTPEEEKPTDGEIGDSSPTSPNVQDICPAGYGVTNIKSDGTAIDSSKEKQISYLFLIKTDEMIGKITPPLIKNGKIVNTVIQYAEVNTENPYKETNSVRGIPTPSCVNLLYTIENDGPIEIPTPPSIQIIQPIIVEKPKPEETISEWTTVEKTMFVGRSNTDKPVKWTGFEKEEVLHENTRILYHFSYFTENRGWSDEVEYISELPLATTARVTASLQVKTIKLKDPNQKHPELDKMKLIYDGGITSEPISKPMVLITPSKDNNKGRMIFSTASNITWDIWTFDPYGYDIVNIEWGGDKKDRYEKAGTYGVKVRVQNSEGVWSNWDSYEFKVYEEKPVASLKVDKAYIKINEPVNWNKLIFDLSYDPDQDGELTREWAGDIKEIYTEEDLGEIEVKLQVKDAEGNLSDWVTQKVVVYDDMLWLNTGPYAYDNKPSTFEPINTRQQIYWLQDLTNRKVTVNLTTNSGTGGLIYILDEEGNMLRFINASSNFTSTSLNYSASIKNREYSFIIPKDAYSIQFVAYSHTVLNEIYVNVEEPLPNEVIDISTESSEHKTNLSFNSNNLKVNVYSDGKYLNSTTTSSFTREPLLSSTLYNYELEVEDSHGNRSDRVSVSVKTTDYDVTFYESTTDVPNQNLVGMFDYDIATSGSVYKNNTHKPLTIKWKVKEGVDFPEDLEGQVLRLYASSLDNGNSSFRIVDKDGNPLEYNLFYSNRIVKSNRTTLSTTKTYYDIVLPKNADALEVYGQNYNYSTAYIFDIRFAGLNSDISLIEDIQFTPSYNNVSMSWTKPENVSIVDVYRDGVYIGQSTNNKYEDKDILESNKVYKYSFMVRNEHNVSKWIDPIEVKTLERDISFYDNSSIDRSILLSSAFDYNTGSVSKIYINNSIEPVKVKWKVKEGAEFPESTKGQVLRVLVSTNDNSNYGAFRVLDKNGNIVRHNLFKGNRLVEASSTSISSTAIYYYIVLPENAETLEFYGASNNYTYINLFDIQFMGLNSEISPIEDIQFTPGYNDVSINWTKPDNVSAVEIYRDGVYVGQSTGNSYQDNSILESNKTYKYSFIVRNEYNISIWINPIEVTTLERDILFYDNSSIDRDVLLSSAFDYNTGSVSRIYINNSIESVKVKWKVKEGVTFPETTKGQVLRVLVSTNDNSNYGAFRVLDKDNKVVKHHLFKGNRMVETSFTSISSSAIYYYLVLPENAETIEFYGASNNYTYINLFDIQFMGLNSEVSLIDDIQFTPGYNDVSISWTKPDNVSAVEVYRDGVYLGQSTGNSYQDNSILESSKSYKYSFIVRNGYNVSKWIDPIEVTTLERDIIFYDNSSLNRDVLLSSAFDYNTSSYSRISINNSIEPVKVKWKVKEGVTFPETTKGQVLRLLVSSNDNSNYGAFRVLDKNGIAVRYHLFKGNKLVDASSTPISSSAIYYYVILPDNAETIEFYGTTNYYTYINLFDIQFMGLNSEVSLIDNIQFTPGHNDVSISWTKPDNVTAVEVYRNGVYVGQSTGSSYYDKGGIDDNKTYNYSFVVRNEYYVSKWMESIEITTLERDITFYEGSSPNRTAQLLNFFDYNVNTNDRIMISMNLAPIIVKWNMKEGLDFSETTKGKVLRIYASINSNSQNAAFRVLDQNGNPVPYSTLSGVKMVETSSTPLSSSKIYYNVVLPENADSIQFYGTNSSTVSLDLFDIQFVDRN